LISMLSRPTTRVTSQESKPYSMPGSTREKSYPSQNTHLFIFLIWRLNAADDHPQHCRGRARPRQQVIEQIRISSRPACYAESLMLWVWKSPDFPFYALGASWRASQITWPNNDVPCRKQRGILFPSDAVIPCLTRNPVCFSGYRLSPV
jgi:hypothetical protein